MKWALIILAFMTVIGIAIGIAVYVIANSEPGNSMSVVNKFPPVNAGR
jgi:hypothetical protein